MGATILLHAHYNILGLREPNLECSSVDVIVDIQLMNKQAPNA